MLTGQNAGCQLCRLLVDLGAADGPEAEVDFQMDQDRFNAVDEPADTQYLLVHARVAGNPDRYMTYCMYTPSPDDPAADEIVCQAPTLQVDSRLGTHQRLYRQPRYLHEAEQDEPANSRHRLFGPDNAASRDHCWPGGSLRLVPCSELCLGPGFVALYASGELLHISSR
ncbi:hypothetical protein BD309DRAFT_983615 [Dichomitus squalens]|uniref:Uncharacterized protein n=1 Tax=Dichomitus squalens TaxID=114155 RepID=A0A4Q9PSX0_9APHY|nr:hypothetical protein BD309DRAFT_983615 [Dichomitus squalens]TBU57533.1 hypothetical protein BD310DRAFT_907126 [Dichomitus squalens]